MALALDIDGTLTTANPRAVSRLMVEADRRGVATHINTARPAWYCAEPDPISLRVSPLQNHHCLVHPDPPTSKVINMNRIQEMSGASKQCTILIDDRPENVDAVIAQGYGGILVDERTGITEKVADVAIQMMDSCLKKPAARKMNVKPRLVVLLILILFIFIWLARYASNGPFR